jgi:hypothetical protein
MEHFWDWLVVLIKTLHFPLIVGLHLKMNTNGEDEPISGDNVPHVFLNSKFK